ncbi:hypothetical protein [Sphingomonas sp.]|uniref:hypothetical protein n=1 Tax=Sphingomonas sp. TaxID=28214 RepID=UPI0028A5AD03|nr:hypothetical protein [Sphingomonas sp.]
MHQIHTLSERERRWLFGGAIASALLTLMLTVMSADPIPTFIAAIGAIGQVGIALALYFVTRAQWKLQEHLAEEQVRQVAERQRLARQAMLDGVREEILWFYRSWEVGQREECYDKMSDHLFQLKTGMGQDVSTAIRKFLHFSWDIVAHSGTEEGRDANGRRMEPWRKSANNVLAMVGAEPIDFGKRRD